MNKYFFGMSISMVVYIAIGIIISRKIRNSNDFFVAGRNAPTILIVGSLVASYCGTGLYFGDAGESFGGIYSPLILIGAMLTAGYTMGAVFFGRFLRRSECDTIPEFFGKRYHSNALRKLAAIIQLITVLVYLLSTMQGIGTLMSLVTGLDYKLCILFALITFTVLTVSSGSKGVLITDTIMFGFFTLTTIAVIFSATGKGGGWISCIEIITKTKSSVLSWSGDLNFLYSSGAKNMIWAFAYGIVWMSVCMVAPWQASRYLMAKNEHVVIRSSVWAAFFAFLLEFFVKSGAVLMNAFSPSISNQSHIIVWMATEMVPGTLGVVMLTGILAAGISSATTFLSLIGTTISHDILCIDDDKTKLSICRIVIIIASVIEFALAYFNPPQVFYIMFLGATVVACSWLPICVVSVWNRKVTKTGAFLGMLFGFLGCSIMKIYSNVVNQTLPIYLDSFFVGIVANLIGIVIGTNLSKITEIEILEYNNIHIIPDDEKNVKEIKKTKKTLLLSIVFGVSISLIMLLLWALPYNKTIR